MKQKLLASFIGILILIGGVFFYVWQSDRKEAKTLDTTTWKTYTNNEFGFRFKYPDYVSVCDVSHTYGPNVPVSLGLYPRQSCELAKYDVPPAHISITPNVSESVEELFQREYEPATAGTSATPTPTSAEPEMVIRPAYITIGNVVGYGGLIAYKSELERKNPPGQYRYVFFVKSGERVFRMSAMFFNTGSSLEVNQSLFNAIAGSLYFDSRIWK